MPRKTGSAPLGCSDVCAALQRIAPLELAQEGDNVGLLAGDVHQPVRKVLLCIDLTPGVADEALGGGIDLVVAYHPPIFKPISRLTAQSAGPEAAVFRCIRAGMAVYSVHTALDAADGGTNDVLARLCGVTHSEPLEYVADPARDEVKCVTFVPAAHVDAVADALAEAGAGRIGEYSRCSFRSEGRGTFFGSAATSPAVGQKGKLEWVDEVRLEMVCPAHRVPQVTAALAAAHPYEEPAYDIYPLQARPVRGIGRHGPLPRPIKLAALARKLKKAVAAGCVQIVGEPDRMVSRAVVVAGAAGSLPFRVGLSSAEVIVTGEIRHHDALTILRTGCSAIALNHWTSERPALQAVADRLQQYAPGIRIALSEADGEPFRPI